MEEKNKETVSDKLTKAKAEKAHQSKQYDYKHAQARKCQTIVNGKNGRQQRDNYNKFPLRGASQRSSIEG